jgi:GntR family transcriptional regulator / MocR family aminotransferase
MVGVDWCKWKIQTSSRERDQLGLAVSETSQPLELLVAIKKDGSRTLGRQIEEQLRSAIRTGVLAPGARVPSTRDLARQLQVSRRVVVDAYDQLAAEGYLALRQGARPRVSDAVAPAPPATDRRREPERPPRYDFRPSVPDVSTFPRSKWLRSLREALAAIADAELGYGDPRGVEALRTALASYLGRVRGVVADPDQVVITSGYTQGLGLVCGALARLGASKAAVEDPCNPEQRVIVDRAGLEPVSAGVDEEGLVVERLASASAVVVTPAHQHPTGALLSADRRASLLAWLREHDAVAIEDDYDAEYRYDRAAVGALQGLDPDRVVYAGSTSKTLAPALRLGWLVVPRSLLGPVVEAKLLGDLGSPRIDQLALAHFIARGELDRHLRRMRGRYRERRDTLIAALADAVPQATVRGIAAGLHVTVELPRSYDEPAIRDACEERRIALNTMSDYRAASNDAPPTLMLGYGQIPEPAIRPGINELADAIAGVAPATSRP